MPADHKLVITPARRLHGRMRVPGDKSISHRYVLLAGMADGSSELTHLAPGQDVAASLRAIRALGADVDSIGPTTVRIHGRGIDALRPPDHPIDAGNSGTTLRLLTGIAAPLRGVTTLVGDASLSRRPMRRVIDPMTAMGARLTSNDGYPPLVIEGAPLKAVSWTSPVPSAQVKSAILFAGLRAAGTTTVHEPAATRDHTERAFPAFGLTVTTRPLEVMVEGGQRPQAPGTTLLVPGDPSSAAVWACAAAALPGSSVEIHDVSVNPLRIAFLGVLERLGATVSVEVSGESGGEPIGTIRVAHDRHAATSIAPDEVPSIIDELPVLAARAALGGGLEVSGAGELRVKESDRITALVRGFRAIGVAADERPDGFVIDGSQSPTGGVADAAHDHRLVMAFALAALGASRPSTIAGADVVAVSYPDFAEDLARLTGC